MSKFFDFVEVTFFIVLYLVFGLTIFSLVLGLAVLAGLGDVTIVVLGLSFLVGILWGLVGIIRVSFFE